jgi:hypothetical protein
MAGGIGDDLQSISIKYKADGISVVVTRTVKFFGYGHVKFGFGYATGEAGMEGLCQPKKAQAIILFLGGISVFAKIRIGRI